MTSRCPGDTSCSVNAWPESRSMPNRYEKDSPGRCQLNSPAETGGRSAVLRCIDPDGRRGSRQEQRWPSTRLIRGPNKRRYGRGLARWRCLASRSGSHFPASPAGRFTAVTMARSLRFQPRRHACMRFWITPHRLTDAVHRRHPASPASPGRAGGGSRESQHPRLPASRCTDPGLGRLRFQTEASQQGRQGALADDRGDLARGEHLGRVTSSPPSAALIQAPRRQALGLDDGLD